MALVCHHCHRCHQRAHEDKYAHLAHQDGGELLDGNDWVVMAAMETDPRVEPQEELKPKEEPMTEPKLDSMPEPELTPVAEPSTLSEITQLYLDRVEEMLIAALSDKTLNVKPINPRMSFGDDGEAKFEFDALEIQPFKLELEFPSVTIQPD